MIPSSRDLVGRRAFVCGASQGIGRACAEELVRCGADVTVIARNEDALRGVVQDLQTVRRGAHDFIAADFDRPDELRSRVAAWIDKNGPVHVLVNNTGGPPHGSLVEASPEQFIKAISNHVICNQLLAQAVIPGMKAAGFGRIVNIISTSVIAPIKGLGVSNTTRGAVANWGRTLAGELAPFGITVNNILPGYTDTDRLQSLFSAKAAVAGISPDAVKQATIDSIPVKRLAAPREIAAVVAFLACPAASYVTGVNLPVDGGRTAVQ